MIGFDFKFADQTKAVKDAAAAGVFKNTKQAAATIRKAAIASIQPGDGPSPPGTPPHTQTAGLTKKGTPRRGNLQRAILFDVAPDGVGIVGPRKSVIGEAGRVHEFGGELFGDEYPERPYMEPALEKNLTRFGDSFAALLST